LTTGIDDKDTRQSRLALTGELNRMVQGRLRRLRTVNGNNDIAHRQIAPACRYAFYFVAAGAGAGVAGGALGAVAAAGAAGGGGGAEGEKTTMPAMITAATMIAPRSSCRSSRKRVIFPFSPAAPMVSLPVFGFAMFFPLQ